MSKIDPVDSVKQSTDYFYSLVRKKDLKKRSCLRCERVFESVSVGNRVCGRCQCVNKKPCNSSTMDYYV